MAMKRQQAVLGQMQGDLPEHTQGPFTPGDDPAKPLPLGDPSAPMPIEAGGAPPPAMESPFSGAPAKPMSFADAMPQTGIAPGEFDPNAGQPIPIGDVQPAAPAATGQTWTPGANAGKGNGMILGYDTGKLNDPTYTKGTKYNDAVRAFSGGLKQDVGLSRGGLDNMINYLKSNGFANAQGVGDDKIDFGDGAGPIDVIRSDGQIVFQDPRGVDKGAGGGNPGAMTNSRPGSVVGDMTTSPINPTAGVVLGDPSAPGPTEAGTTANAPGMPAGWEDAGNGWAVNPATGQRLPTNHPDFQKLLAAAPPPAAGAPGAPGQPTNPKAALQQRILEMLNTNTTNVTANDPNLLPQVNASRVASQRAEERARNLAAERRHSGGFGGSGALDTDIERLSQARGEAEAANESGLVANELRDRFGRVQQAMGMQAGIDAQDKDIAHNTQAQERDIAMRKQLAELDAAIRRADMDQRGQLSNRGMDLQDAQYWAGLGQGDRQFNDTLGFNIGKTNSDNYYRWLMAGMGG